MSIQAQGASCIEYEWTIPSKFMVGTEQGTNTMFYTSNNHQLSGNVFSCLRKGKSKDRIGNIYQAHYGPVYALQRNPSFPKVDARHQSQYTWLTQTAELLDSWWLVCQDLVRGYQGECHHVDKVSKVMSPIVSLTLVAAHTLRVWLMAAGVQRGPLCSLSRDRMGTWTPGMCCTSRRPRSCPPRFLTRQLIVSRCRPRVCCLL